jgi:hypothetical protein
VSNDSLVDEMELSIGAGTNDRACLPDLVARLKERDLRTNGFHDSRRIIARDPIHISGQWARSGSQLGVDWVERDSLDLYSEIFALSFWNW